MFIGIITAFIAGGCVVISRMVNAGLALRIGTYQATLSNNIVGFFVSILFLLMTGASITATETTKIISQPWLLIGALLGIAVVLLSNKTSYAMPAVYLTLFIFIAQLITGLFLDTFIGKVPSPLRLLGGLFILAGLALQIHQDNVSNKNKTQSE